MRIVKVLLFDVNKTPIEEDFLTEADYLALERIKSDKTRKEKAISLMIKNKYIGNYHIGENGKPLSNEKHFNISHKDDYLAFVIDEVPVGIDIEHIEPMKDRLADFISSDAEKAYIKDDVSFFEIWTNKEALVKANGLGLRQKVESIPSLPINGLRSFEEKTYRNVTMKYKDYIITVSRESDEEFILKIEEN